MKRSMFSERAGGVRRTARHPAGLRMIRALVGLFVVAGMLGSRTAPLAAAETRTPGHDTNDALDTRAMTAAERTAINTLCNFPTDPYIANCWSTAEAIYRSIGSVAVFRVYPGVGHSYSTEMINDLVTFFAAHR